MSVDWTQMANNPLPGADCLPCCPTPAPPAVCPCALIVPNVPFFTTLSIVVSDNPYASYADALDAITNLVANCLVFNSQYNAFIPSYITYDSYTATFDGTTLAVDGACTNHSGDFNAVYGWASVNIDEGGQITIVYSLSIEDTDPEPEISIRIYVYTCGGETVYSYIDRIASLSESGTKTTDALPAGGYIVFLYVAGSADGGVTSGSWDITCSEMMIVNPIIAQYDDGGTTRNLWACPRLIIPPLAEATGTWYADDTHASDAISNQTNGCKGYIADTTHTAFTASGSSSLSLDGTGAADQTTVEMWGGINALAGETLTFTYTLTPSSGTASAEIYIYDDNGVAIEMLTGSSPQVSTALTYSGRFTLKFAATITGGSAGATLRAQVTVSSSGTMTVNPIQAFYDVGLDCPATLDCT